MLKKYLKEFIYCHNGTFNKIIHVVGFTVLGIGVIEKSLSFVIIGGITQELGHVYQYLKTKNPQESPLYCLKPQSIFAFPLFILLVAYVLVAK